MGNEMTEVQTYLYVTKCLPISSKSYSYVSKKRFTLIGRIFIFATGISETETS